MKNVHEIVEKNTGLLAIFILIAISFGAMVETLAKVMRTWARKEDPHLICDLNEIRNSGKVVSSRHMGSEIRPEKQSSKGKRG